MLLEVATADEVHGHISDADSISAASTNKNRRGRHGFDRMTRADMDAEVNHKREGNFT